MTYIVFVFLFGLVLSVIVVASGPSPIFAALALVVVAGMGCGVLVKYGGSFLSLVLFLIYLGGMLVVFAYSVALVADPDPAIWGSPGASFLIIAYAVGVVLTGCYLGGGWYEASWVPADGLEEYFLFRGDVGGVALMYSAGGNILVISAWVLLLTLLVVLELTRGLARGTLRAV